MKNQDRLSITEILSGCIPKSDSKYGKYLAQSLWAIFLNFLILAFLLVAMIFSQSSMVLLVVSTFGLPFFLFAALGSAIIGFITSFIFLIKSRSLTSGFVFILSMVVPAFVTIVSLGLSSI